MKHTIFYLLVIGLACSALFAQTTGYREGDRVGTPDGRQGTIESFKMPDMAKVKFDDGTAKFYIRADLKKIEPPKSVRNEPQENLQVGDMVIDASKPDTLKREGKIESISGNTAMVRFGPYKYDAFRANRSDLVSLQTWQRRQNEEKEAKLSRAAFEDEAHPFMNTIRLMAPSYNPKLMSSSGSGFEPTAATYEAWRKDLEKLAGICQKYPNLTNQPFADEPPYSYNISYRQADWCEMARQRDTLIKGFLKDVGSDQTKYSTSHLENIFREASGDPNGYIKDEVQMVLFDRAAWIKKNAQNLKTQFNLTDAEIETKVFTTLEGKINELKAKIERDAQTRSWTQPAYKDAALEGLVKAAYVKEFPGVKVYKTGMTYATWKAYDDTSLIGSDSNYKFYKYEKNKYRQKDGLILVQLPGQTLCQIRNFTLQQTRTGAAFGAARSTGTAKGGIFVKCP